MGFVTAINALTSQAWAFLIMLLGVAAAIVFHRIGLAMDIAAGIIGAGVNMFTAQASRSSTQTDGDKPPVVRQTTEAPGPAPAQPNPPTQAAINAAQTAPQTK